MNQHSTSIVLDFSRGQPQSSGLLLALAFCAGSLSRGGSFIDFAVGRGLRAAPELAERCLAAGAQLYVDLLPRAREVLQLARPIAAGGQTLSPELALPVYVRDRVVAVTT